MAARPAESWVHSLPEAQNLSGSFLFGYIPVLPLAGHLARQLFRENVCLHVFRVKYMPAGGL